MHPSERAHVLREDAWDRTTLAPRIAPGTQREAEAIEAIDRARADERAALGDTFEARQRRIASWWGKGQRSRFEG
jgi:hypothetical protein